MLGIILARSFIPEHTDMYLFVWNGINVVLIFISTINLLVVSPAYIRLKENGEPGKANQVNNFFFNFYFIPLILFSLLCFLAPVWLFDAFSGFDDHILSSFSPVLRYSGIWMLLVLLNNFFGNILLSNRLFSFSLAGQVIVAITTISFIVLARDSMGISSFFAGQITGNILCFLFYQYFLIKKVGYAFRLFVFSVPVKIVRETIASILSAVVTLTGNFLFLYFLSELTTGYLSAYNYGSNLANLPDVLLLSQFVSIIGVRFSAINARDDHDTLYIAYSSLSYHVFFLMAGIAILLSLLSPVFIRNIYGENALGAEIFNAAVFAMAMISLILPFKAIDVLNNRLLASYQAMSVVVRYTIPLKVFNICVLVILAYWGNFKSLLAFQLISPVLVVLMQLWVIKRYFFKERILQHTLKLFSLLLLCLFLYGVAWVCNTYVFSKNSEVNRVIMLLLLVVVLAFLVERLFRITIFYSWIRGKLSILFRERRQKLNH